MNKTIILLIALALIASSCGQSGTKKQAVNIETYCVEDTSTTVNNTDFVEVESEIEEQNMSDSQLFDIQEIDSVKYFAAKGKTATSKTKWEKITDLEQAKKMLKERVIWGEYDNETHKFVEDEQGEIVSKMHFRNGKTYLYEHPEAFFIAYYPQEDILLLEGEHTTDVSFNLTTGEETENVGNPEYIIFSPSKQYRLNGHFNGQECSSWFIQKKIDGCYQKIIQIDSQREYEKSEFEKRARIWFCDIVDVFWQDDTTLNFVTPIVDGKEIKLYYQLTLK